MHRPPGGRWPWELPAKKTGTRCATCIALLEQALQLSIRERELFEGAQRLSELGAEVVAARLDDDLAAWQKQIADHLAEVGHA